MKFPNRPRFPKLAKQKNRYNPAGSRISLDLINPKGATGSLRLRPRLALVIEKCSQALIDTFGMTPGTCRLSRVRSTGLERSDSAVAGSFEPLPDFPITVRYRESGPPSQGAIRR